MFHVASLYRKDKTKRKSQSKYQKSSSKRLEQLERHELRERGWRDDDDSDYMWPLFTDESEFGLTT